MLAASQFPPSSSPKFSFLPAIPSPLSPRSANIYGRHPARGENVGMSQSESVKGQSYSSDRDADGSSSVFSPTSTSNAPSARPTPFSQRSVKKAPTPRPDELKERRRTAFLRKVREGREDTRFEARGEDIMRMDFMSRRRDYEEEFARSAPVLPVEPVEEEEAGQEYDLPGYGYGGGNVPGSQPMQSSSWQGSQMQLSRQTQAEPRDEVAEFLREEDEELNALLEYMPTDDSAQVEMDVQSQGSDNLWSDDADYDELFSEVLSHENADQRTQFGPLMMGGPQQQQLGQQVEGDAMDMS